MNNLFGIPDEVVSAVISAVAKQQQEMAKKGYKPQNPFKVDLTDPNDLAKKSASMVKQLYDAYVGAGFTQEQAFELTKGILTAKRS